MTTTSRMILSAALAVIAALTSATAAVARPMPVPASSPSGETVNSAAEIPVGSSPLWQFAVVALVAALIAAVVTHLAETRSAQRSGLDVSPSAG